MNKENTFQLKGFVVWSITVFFFLYEFFLRTSIGAYQQQLMSDLDLTSFQFSLLSTTIFFLIYGIMQIPAGLLVGNIGLKKSLGLAAFSCTIASLGFAYSYTYLPALIFRMLMGFGASFGFICLLMAIHDWMPHRYNAIFIGLSQLIGTMGPMLAAGPLETLTHSTGVSWRFVFICLAGIGFVTTLVSLLFVEGNKQQSGDYTIIRRPEKITSLIGRLFNRMQPWYLAIFSATVYFSMEYLTENEGRIFLSLKGMSVNTASYMLTIGWIGYAIGCPLVGFLSDFFSRRKNIMAGAALLGLFAITTVIYAKNSWFLAAAFFLLGVSASGQTVAFATVAEQFKKQFVAIGFGLNNGMITLLSAISAPLMGLVLDHIRQGSSTALNEYIFVFNILIIFAVTSVVISVFFIKETFCKSAVDFTYLRVK